MTSTLVRIGLGVLPVALFLATLVYLDSYKLVRPRLVLGTLVAGGAMAGIAYWAGIGLSELGSLKASTYSRYFAPLIEEGLKALAIGYLLLTSRLGFLVDATILGFAAGAGFAMVENLWYLQALPHTPVATWIIRGFGTAIMHGGAGAILAMIAKSLSERGAARPIAASLLGLAAAVTIHSVFNHFFLSPVVSACAVLIALPPLVAVVFRQGELALRRWLDVGFDADTEMLELIHSGRLSDSRVGRYLSSLRERFRGEVVADLLCYLRLHLELSLRAKGLLMMREAGFRPSVAPEVRALLDELGYLDRAIGATGKLAMAPFIRRGGRETWQLALLEER
ncbi:MAG: PrsW family intramembrane metalloprotease [Acidobacteria bacterium]|nr:PrsW family intramembrane metalloprotease [Acidobacteriota bacterium]